MTVMDWLRKLGIIRFGVKSGTYTSAKDMPTEFLMDGVYNAEKDLVTQDDLTKVVSAVKGSPAACKCGAELTQDAKFCGSCGGKIN